MQFDIFQHYYLDKKVLFVDGKTIPNLSHIFKERYGNSAFSFALEKSSPFANLQ